MSAHIDRSFPLIHSCAAQKIAARGVPVCGCGDVFFGPGVEPSGNARQSAPIARVHSFARHVHFPAGAVGLRAEAARPDAAIARNLKELEYGG